MRLAAATDTTMSPGADFYSYASGTYVKNLVIPPYSYPSPGQLLIGKDETSGAAA